MSVMRTSNDQDSRLIEEFGKIKEPDIYFDNFN